MILRPRFMLALLLGSIALAPAAAFAEQGRISFSGRIVEATCGTSDTAISSIDKPPRHMNCDRAGGGSPSRNYALSVTRLNGNQDDRVLSYFASYVRATSTGTAVPVLLMKVYD